ncbi:MAG: hypothetical protein NZM06_06135 [Chloroherpetonaceae bacterium]|nr:hypothetical protein [Chloroherpetonaceae bacterium]MDW8437510.1 hypothetical protein [Chloroherpetonaceae bacterium]
MLSKQATFVVCLCVVALASVSLCRGQAVSRAYPVTSEKKISARVKLGLVNLKIGAHQSLNAFEYRYAASDPTDLRYEYEISQDGVGELELSNLRSKNAENKNISFRLRDWFGADEDKREELPTLTLTFTDQLPIELFLTLAAGEHELDLSSLKLSSLELHSGACQTSVRFSKPNREAMERLKIATGASRFVVEGLGNANFKELNLHGGASDVTLDFSGELKARNAKAKISLGAGSLTVIVPQNEAVKLNYADNIFSSIDLPKDFKKKGDMYFSGNYGQGLGILEFDISSGMGAVKVEWK